MRLIDQLFDEWMKDLKSTKKANDYLGMSLAEFDEYTNHGVVPDRLVELTKEVDPE